MAQTSLAAGAQAQISNVHGILDDARRCVQNIETACDHMRSSWQGNQAGLFQKDMARLVEDCNAVLTTMTNVAETGINNMRNFINSEF
jgi:hypothetical protein